MRHTREKPFQCNSCSQAFCTRYGLMKHKEHFHDDEELSQCDINHIAYTVDVTTSMIDLDFPGQSLLENDSFTDSLSIADAENPLDGDMQIVQSLKSDENMLLFGNDHTYLHVNDDEPFANGGMIDTFSLDCDLMKEVGICDDELLNTVSADFQASIDTSVLDNSGFQSVSYSNPLISILKNIDDVAETPDDVTNVEEDILLDQRKRLKIVLDEGDVPDETGEKSLADNQNDQTSDAEISKSSVIFECKVCLEKFLQMETLISHQKTHADGKVFQCGICLRGFSTSQGAKRHMKHHNNTSDKSFFCNLCDAKCERSKDLQNHKKQFHEKGSFSCYICKQTFSLKRSLEAHKKRRHFSEPVNCTICNKSFINKESMRSHLLAHKDERPYKCDVCQQGFNQASHLLTHKRLHTGEKPFKCDVCSKSFTRGDYLRIHKRRHTGETPYQCEFCDKSFHAKLNLRTHLRCHTGEKPYSCKLCDKSFTQPSHLKLHNKLHLKKEVVKCNFCDKTFLDGRSLVAHRAVHANRPIFYCEVCGKSFLRPYTLNLHKRSHAEKDGLDYDSVFVDDM